jgi:hypothetical protein
MLGRSVLLKIHTEHLDVTERNSRSSFIDERECIECGHAVSLHTDAGCVYRDTGTGEAPPLACRCKVTGFELRMNQALTRQRRERDRPN